LLRVSVFILMENLLTFGEAVNLTASRATDFFAAPTAFPSFQRQHKVSHLSRRSLSKQRPGTPASAEISRLLAQGNARHRAGDLHGAEALYRQALALDGRQPDTLHLLGIIAIQSHRPKDAVTLLRRAVSAAPDRPEYQLNLGLALRASGQAKPALACFRKVLKEMPSPPAEAHVGLAQSLLDLQQFPQAEACLQEALRRHPDRIILQQLLGDTLKRSGRLEQAEQHYRQILQQHPDHPPTLLNLANLLAARGRLQEALQHYQALLVGHPDDPELRYNLGTALNQAGKPREALPHLQFAASRRPDHAPTHNNLGSALADLQQLDDAVAAFEHAVRLDAAFLEARDNLVNSRLKLADWRDVPKLRQRLVEPALRAGPAQPPLRPFAMLGLPVAISSAEQQRLIRAYAARETQRAGVASVQPYQHISPEPRPRLRVGYLSSDFRTHATAHLIQGLFARHDRRQLEVICYSTGVDDASSYRQRIMQDCDAFHDLHGLGWQTVAGRIHDDRIDILVDLNGFTAGDRFPALALRPAPIQVSYLGFPGTLGSDCMDYLIADASVVPPGEEHHYDESIVRMPHSYQVNDQDRPIADTPSRQDCGLPETAVVFCCFCNTYKLEPMIFGTWMRILQRVEGSVLWLLGKNASAERNLRAAAAAHDLDPARLVFAPPLPQAGHLARHRLADLALDTHFYNGHTTTSDALWAGLPVITHPGRSFASRVSLGLLRAVGLAELAVEDLAAYEELAVTLALDPPARAALRDRLAARRLSCPLFDTDRFARHLEQAYRIMWDRYCRGEPATGFDLSDQA